MSLQDFRLTVVLLLATSGATTEVLRARRRCEDKTLLLQSELTTLRETQEVLQGEVLSLRESLESIRSLVTSTLPEDCSVAKIRGSWSSTSLVKPPGLPTREVRCEQTIDGGGWTEILVRKPTHPTAEERLNFNTSWSSYKEGFGDINGEFWIGNEYLHAVTRVVPHTLRVLLTDWHDNTATAVWDYFRVGSEEDLYRLNVSGYHERSSAGDSLRHHNDRAFSTFDQDNDIHNIDHCAKSHGGGWWYFSCYEAHPTGAAMEPDTKGHDGIVWRTWKGSFGLKRVIMMIRPHPRVFASTSTPSPHQ